MFNKKIWISLLIVSVVTTGILAAFLILNQGPLQILIKDAPYDNLVSINVDVAAVEIHKQDENRWIPLMSGVEKRVNCSVTGEVERICDATLETGTYDMIRIKFNHIRLHYHNGTLCELQKYENQNMIQNLWLNFTINFTYDGAGGQILFDITVNNNYEAVVTIVKTVS